VAFSFDPLNVDTEPRGQLTEKNDFVGPSITIRRRCSETRPYRYPQFPRRTDFLDIAYAPFGSTAGEQPEGRQCQANQDRNSAPHTFTLLRTGKMAAQF